MQQNKRRSGSTGTNECYILSVFKNLLQVLSKYVADAFAYKKDPATKETALFCRNFDRFFDCLNVRSLKEYNYNKKEA